MAEYVHINEISNDQFRKTTDFENFFKVHRDKYGNIVFNLNETIYFDIEVESLLVHNVETPMHWPLLSYKLYGTTRLAWLLMKLNNVLAIDMFERLEPGDRINYINIDFIRNLVSHINGYSSNT